MRWEQLFDDLEAQLEAQQRREQDAEIVDLIRAERARVTWMDRLRGQPGAVTVIVTGARHPGRVVQVGPDWILLRQGEPAGFGGAVGAEAGGGPLGTRDVVVPAAAVVALWGVRPGAMPAAPGVARRLGLASVLRGLARDRIAVAVGLPDGTSLTGTPAAVGADHVDLRCHEPGDPRAQGPLWTLPFQGLTSLRLV